MDNRNYSSDNYRYGFNGKEKDDEVKGAGNEYDYGMRIYDPRLGRFMSVDPLYIDFPELSTYQYASLNPIENIDLDGLEGKPSEKGANGATLQFAQSSVFVAKPIHDPKKNTVNN